ncbi:MAG: pilus assembly PilX N-terminal domain-containing protein [Acidobacteria bacterium]|nr:pilus assembly PilX N-terminal domain-containing protein [Acidobacteriota bacterium]
MNCKSQKGSALILTIILIAVLSVMTASMMFLSQSEAWSSYNYKLMSQARDAAEAGLNRSAHFLMNDYTPPETPADIALFNRFLHPVRDAADGRAVVLSADPDITSNYPDLLADVQDAYDAASQGALTAGNQAVAYETSAVLLGMRQIPITGSLTPKVFQRWEITSKGSLDGIEDAEVEVSAILDQTTDPTYGYALKGLSEQCDPPGLVFGGNTMTDSYDSTPNYVGMPGYDASQPTCNPAFPVTATNCARHDSDGNVATYGSMETQGGTVDINGSLSTPRTGVGECGINNAVDNPDVLEDGLIQLTQTPEMEDPDFPTLPTPLLANQTLPNNASTCPLIAGCTPTVPPAKNKFNLAPGAYGNISGGGGANKEIHLSAGTYNINSLDLGSNVTVVIDNGPVILNISGCTSFNTDVPPTACDAYMAAPLTTTGGSFTNASMDPSNLQILYAGEGELQLRGTSGLAAVVYAPSAHVETVGTTDFYGSIVGYTIDMTGTSAVHYDRALENGAQSPGPFMMQGFTWKKF